MQVKNYNSFKNSQDKIRTNSQHLYCLINIYMYIPLKTTVNAYTAYILYIYIYRQRQQSMHIYTVLLATDLYALYCDNQQQIIAIINSQ